MKTNSENKRVGISISIDADTLEKLDEVRGPIHRSSIVELLISQYVNKPRPEAVLLGGDF